MSNGKEYEPGDEEYEGVSGEEGEDEGEYESEELPELVEVDPVQAAIDKKAEGNKKYKAKEYEEAVALYSESITLDPKEATYLGTHHTYHHHRLVPE